jgi:hypothetical protein
MAPIATVLMRADQQSFPIRLTRPGTNRRATLSLISRLDALKTSAWRQPALLPGPWGSKGLRTCESALDTARRPDAGDAGSCHVSYGPAAIVRAHRP